MSDRSVLILGTNSKKYLDFALNCARSIKLYNPDLKIFIGTNIIPEKNIEEIDFIKIEDEIAKLFIETKLYLDIFLQTEETLYIDSDMLCFGDLNPVFDLCSSMDVTVLGKPVKLEDYWGEEGAVFARKQFNIDQSILFNGGLYYLKKSELTKKIYSDARKLSQKYDEYGFIRIQNGWKNEEELVSVSMTAHKQRPIDDGGLIVAGFSKANEINNLNVLTGKIKKYNTPHGKIEDFKIKSPILFHFGGENMNSPLYIAQKTLLKLNRIGVSAFIATSFVNLTINWPHQFYLFLKLTLKKVVRK